MVYHKLISAAFLRRTLLPRQTRKIFDSSRKTNISVRGLGTKGGSVANGNEEDDGKSGNEDKSTTFFTSLRERTPDFLRDIGTNSNPPINYVDPVREKQSLEAFEHTLSVDSAGLFNPGVHLADKPDFTDLSLGFEESTPLGEDLIKMIGTRGPITTATFMSMALTDPNHGYYTSKSLDDDLFDEDNDDDVGTDDDGDASPIIGRRGDFTTAPEISQLFGECLLLWYQHCYRHTLKSPSSVQMVEIGAGKGTLMADILSNACASFPDLASALANGGGVHLVEVGRDMRDRQREALEKTNGRLRDAGFELVFGGEEHTNTSIQPIRVNWHDSLSHVPPTDVHGKYLPHLVLCQEFLDALPIHSFQRHEDGTWRERMVDVAVTDDDDDDDDNDEVNKILLDALPQQKRRPRLRFVLSKDRTPAVDALMKHVPPEEARVGDVVEVCPAATMLVQDVAARLTNCGGAALIVDYGTVYGTGDTLRGFHKHAQVHPLSLPGKVDVTADVVFGSLRQELEQMKGVTVHGPAQQGHFLTSMGAAERALALIEEDHVTDEEATDLFRGLERLVSPEEMGERYKVLGILSGVDRDVPGF